MPICRKKNFIFFHIPRCGGTSIESFFGLLFEPGNLYGVIKKDDRVITLQHLTPPDLKKLRLLTDDTYETSFKFTIIRDPFDRMASDYLWQKKHDRHNEFAQMSFDDYLKFAEQILKDGGYFKKVFYDHFRPMVMYCLQDGELLVDDILLLENIENELDRIRDIIGPVDLPWINKSADSYQELKTSYYIDKVYSLYSADKELYDRIVALQEPGEL